MIKPFIIIFLLTIFTFATDMKLQNKEFVKEKIASRTLPQQVDKATRLVNIETNKSAIVYIYEIDTAISSNKDINSMREAVIRGTCLSSKQFLDAHISLQYLYKNARTKAELFKFYVNQDSCVTL